MYHCIMEVFLVILKVLFLVALLKTLVKLQLFMQRSLEQWAQLSLHLTIIWRISGWRHIPLYSRYLSLESLKIVPWHLSNIWQNCTILLRSMNFIVTHIFREENHCVDDLDNITLALNKFFYWNDILSSILDNFCELVIAGFFFR